MQAMPGPHALPYEDNPDVAASIGENGSEPAEVFVCHAVCAQAAFDSAIALTQEAQGRRAASRPNGVPLPR